MIPTAKAAASVLVVLTFAMASATNLSQSRYRLKGDLIWTRETNSVTYPFEVFRDGKESKILQVMDGRATNYECAGFLSTPKMALTYFQWGRDIKGSDRYKNSSNNGQVSISSFRMPTAGQLTPIWLMTIAAEEIPDANQRRPTAYAYDHLNDLHERHQVVPVSAIATTWPDGFSRYTEHFKNEASTNAYDTDFTITKWTNCNGITFPKQCIGTMASGKVHFEVDVSAIEELSTHIDTQLPYLSTVLDWRPMELQRLTNGCSYFVTNGIVFDDVVAAARKGLVKYYPALDWNQSHPVKIGSDAPDFHVTDLSGQKFRLSGFRGKFVVLDFWSTTCGPCIGQIPDLQKVYRDFEHDRRVVIIGLALDESEKKVKSFVKDHKMPWRQVALRQEFDDPVARAYRINGIPTSFVIGPDGKIVSYGFDLKGAIEEASHKN